MGDFFVIMKKEFRVKSPIEFQSLMTKRKFKNSKTFTVYFQPKKGEHGRYGITAPKKIGNAVVRNKIRRQVRMMLIEIDCFNLGFDAVILVRKPFLTQTYEENRLDLEKLLKTVKI